MVIQSELTGSVIQDFGREDREREALFDVVLVWEQFWMRAAGTGGTVTL